MTWRLGIRERLGGFPLVSHCLLIVSLGAFLLGTKPARIDDGGALLVEQRSVSLGALPPEAEVPVTFTATNRTGKPVKLLGVSQFCTDWGCVYSEASVFPAWVAPGLTSTFHLKVRTNGTLVQFNTEVTLYSDAPGCERTPLAISGRVVDSAAP